MIKIAHLREINSITVLPREVITVIEEASAILDTEYGEDRDVDHGYGGYVLVVESKAELIKLQVHRIDLETTVFEYVDKIPCDDGQVYVSALVLLGSDNGIVLIMPLELFNERATKIACTEVSLD